MKGHEEIHVYVEHPIDNSILVDERVDVSEGVQPLAVEQGPMCYYGDGNDDDDHDGGEFYSFYDSDDMYANDQTFNNEDEPIKVDANDQTFNADVAASRVGSRRVGKEPIIKHPPQVFIISDASDSGGGGSELNDEVEWNHGVRDFVEDNSDSWDGKDDVVELGQMGADVMNFDYESEELYNLVESSSDDKFGYDSDDDAEDDRSTHVGNGKGLKNEEVKKFPVFKLVAKAELISFEKNMLFTTPKQFKEAITKYAIHDGWGIKFVKK